MKFKLVYIVHGIILLLFIVLSINGCTNLFKFHSLVYSDVLSINTLWDTVVTHKILIPVFPLIVPTIGVFFKNYFSWIFIGHYFYLLIFNLLIGILLEGISDVESTLLFIAMMTLTVLSVFLMNSKKVSFDYYKIKKEQLLGINIISFVIGGCISLLLYMFRNLHYIN